jgi:N-acylneuraminate cytidylyltransferase/CMP-N,N'-diacetyllegionaminic acid synthase
MDGLILIPARSGSTRVKGKNIRILGDKPLIAHIIESARRSHAGRVVLSTDSREIAEIANRFGAETPFLRPKELATSDTSSISVIVHALQWFKEHEKWDPDIVAFCPPTNPFTQPSTIAAMRELLAQDQEIASVVTVSEPWTHPFRIVHLTDSNELKNAMVSIGGKTINDVERSQDWPKVWAGSPACRMSRADYFKNYYGNDLIALEGNTYDVSRCKGFLINKVEAFDINDGLDFALAERILPLLHEANGLCLRDNNKSTVTKSNGVCP